MSVKESPRSHAKLIAIIAAVAAGSACSSGQQRAEREDASFPSTQAMTLEHVLKQPLAQGRDGLLQVTADLFKQAGYPKEPGTLTGDIVTKDGLTLADGYRLSAIVDYTKAGVLGIAVAPVPCFPLDRAAAITGAQPVAAVSYPYAEGPNYDTRSAIGKGVEVNLGRFAAGEKCLAEIRLVDVQKARKFIEDNGVDLPAKNLDASSAEN